MKLRLILYLLLLVSGCKSFKRKPPPEPPEPEITIDMITIASWNLKNFGESKLGDPVRMNIIIDVLTTYDIIAVQEV